MTETTERKLPMVLEDELRGIEYGAISYGVDVEEVIMRTKVKRVQRIMPRIWDPEVPSPFAMPAKPSPVRISQA